MNTEKLVGADKESLTKKVLLAPLRFAERLRDRIGIFPAVVLLVSVPIAVIALGSALNSPFLETAGFAGVVAEGLYFLQAFSET